MYRRTCSVIHRHWNEAYYLDLGSFVSTPSSLIGSKPSQCHLVSGKKRPFKARSVIGTYRSLSVSSDDGVLNGVQLQQQHNQQEFFLGEIRDTLSNDILPQVLKDAEGSWSDGKTPTIVFLLAVSGGCDSIALFHSLREIISQNNSSREKLNLIFESSAFPCEMHVAHFDHQQRGTESNNDRMFVQSLCDKENIPFHCFFWGNQRKHHNDKAFSQDIARDWRRSTLQKLLTTLLSSNSDPQNQRLGLVLTAHHRDDSEETILLKILRGAHITNISGMNTVIHMNHDNDPAKTTFAKPMLSLRKADIVNYLTSKGFAWREDASNSSNKYLRNRVRNELMPLLRDIVGGDIILQSRLENLEEQSKKVKQDLTARAEEYLKESRKLATGDENSKFFLPSDNGVFNLVHEEALYQWSEMRMEGHHSLTYEQIKRVHDQLTNCPEQRQWSLDIGRGWSLVRNGIILDIGRKNLVGKGAEQLNVSKSVTATPWSIAAVEWSKPDTTRDKILSTGAQQHQIALDIYVSDQSTDSKKQDLRLGTLQGNENMIFIPPWRRGRSPIKIKEFLRGQKVPLHKRPSAPILYFKNEPSNDQVVAVFVERLPGKNTETDPIEREGRWVVHADFDTQDAEKSNQCLRVFLQCKAKY